MSLNLHRHHLSPTQLSMVAARARAIYDKVREIYDQQAKERMQTGGEKSGKVRRNEGPVNLPDLQQGDARDLAGKAVGVSGKTRPFEGTSEEAVAFVLSLNLHRRQLSASQISMVGDKVRALYDEQAKARLKTKGGHSGPVNVPEAKGTARDKAGKAVGVKLKTRQFEGGEKEAIDFALSANLHRRHLSPTQLGMVAGRARKFYDAAAKERQKLSEGRGQKGPVNLPDLQQGDARDLAGKAVGVSGKTVDYATSVLNNATPADSAVVNLPQQNHGLARDLAGKFYDRQAKERLKTSTGGSHPRPMVNLPEAEKGSARDKAGKAVGVSGSLVDTSRCAPSNASTAPWKRKKAGGATFGSRTPYHPLSPAAGAICSTPCIPLGNAPPLLGTIPPPLAPNATHAILAALVGTLWGRPAFRREYREERGTRWSSLLPRTLFFNAFRGFREGGPKCVWA